MLYYSTVMKSPTRGIMRQVRRTAVRLYLVGKKVWNKLFPTAAVQTPEQLTGRAVNNLENQIVVITGSAKGIGLALAKAFAANGASVVINGRSSSSLQTALQALGQTGGKIFSVQADVSSSEGAKKLIALSFEKFGQVDVLINNAGTMGPIDKPTWKASSSEWTEVINGNLMAAVHCSSAVAEHATSQHHPVRIINVSSGIVGHGMKNLGLYAVTKEALEGLTRAYSCDSEGQLISAVSVQPRSVRTAMTKGFFESAAYAMMDEPYVVADAFLWAATAPAADVQGQTISEPVFAGDPAAAKAIKGTLVGSPPITIHPETFIPGSKTDEAPGAHMHLLENALGPYPSAAEVTEKRLDDRRLYSYPDPAYINLKQAIAQEVNLTVEELTLGAGSSEIINRILQMFCRPGDDILVTKPTWSFFHAFAQRWQVISRHIPMKGSLSKGDLQHDLNALANAITPKTKLVYLVNPCNPTGSMLPPDELEEFILNLPPHIVFVLDEAYIQYSEPSARPSLEKILASCPARIIVLRTFSKFFGLSGYRVGYSCSSAETALLLSRADMPFGITSSAAVIAPAVLNDITHREKVYESNRAGFEQLASGLSSLDIAYLPTQTNFVLFECPTDPKRLREELRAKGLVLPDVDQFLQNYALLAIGKPEHNSLMLETLSKY